MAIHLHAIEPFPATRTPSPARAQPYGTTPAAGLMDWRSFHSELRCAAVTATQTGAPLSLLMLELVAGQSGERGDAEPAATPISGLAGLIKAAVGERACLARYAAERFAIILIDSDLDAAIGQAQGIARNLSAERRGVTGAIDLDASPAIGIAQFRDDESLGHLIQRTVEALGRARIERGPAVIADRGAEEGPWRPEGAALPAAAYALNDRG